MKTISRTSLLYRAANFYSLYCGVGYVSHSAETTRRDLWCDAIFNVVLGVFLIAFIVAGAVFFVAMMGDAGYRTIFLTAISAALILQLWMNYGYPRYRLLRARVNRRCRETFVIQA